MARKPDMTYGLVPGALAAERAVLGLILELSKKTPEIVEKLGNGRCFSHEHHRIIYQAAVALIRQGKQPDLPTVVDHLRASGLLKPAGGASYISGLQNQGVDSSAEQYCEEIVEASGRIDLDHALLTARIDPRKGKDLYATVKDLSGAVETISSQGSGLTGYRLQSVSEILESGSDEIPWCVENLLPADGLGILSGESGCGKTWLVLTLALAVARGELWLGRFKTSKGPVLLLDEESGETLLKQRLKLLGVRLSDSALPLRIACFQGPQLDTPEGQEELASEIKSISASLVIIDSLVRVHSLEENSASDMKILMTGLARIAREENCAILLTHHARKKSKESNEGGQRLRGSTELKAAVDMHLFAKWSGDNEIRVEHEKARYARPESPFVVTIEESDEGILSFAARDEKQAKVEQAKELIIEMLSGADGPVLRKELEAMCKEEGVRTRTFAEAVKRLKDDGRLHESQVDRSENGKAKTLEAFSLR